MTNSRAKKFDSGKPDLSLIPRVALDEEARAFMYGAEKYGRYNFHKGMEVSRLIAAALRHITAYNEGAELDIESHVHHLGHARACLAMILKQAELGTLIDDRATTIAERAYYDEVPDEWPVAVPNYMHEFECDPVFDIFGEHNHYCCITGFRQSSNLLGIDVDKLGSEIQYNAVAGHPEYSSLTFPDGYVRYINVSAEGLDSIASGDNRSTLNDDEYKLFQE